MLMILSRGGRALKSEVKRAGTNTSFVVVFEVAGGNNARTENCTESCFTSWTEKENSKNVEDTFEEME
jgi:predicted  nucleic acid-binding Zn ribbon protein